MSTRELNAKIFKGAFFHGADYNPEQWLHLPEVLDEDIKLMKKANCNVMAVNIFGWSTIEPSEGIYSFDHLDKVINRLHENDIKVILATPTGARPNWLAKKYQETNRVSESGVRFKAGLRHNHCYSSPVFRDKAKNIVRILAERYKDHEGIVLWHISNEFEGECHCPLCQQAFRNWLAHKYDHDIEKLNTAWWTRFWSHTYTSFDQVESPSSIGEYWVHGQNIDWKRFVTHQTIDYLKEEVALLKEITPHIPVTTNTHDYVHLGRSINYWELVKHIDIVSWDNYPTWHAEPNENWETGVKSAFIHDINRSLKGGQPYLLMESSPSATNWQPVAKLLRPGMQNLAGIQALAHGSNSVQYFQWRKSLGSFEKFHGAVVDHYSSDQTRVFKEVSKLGQDLSVMGQMIESRVEAKAAIIYDWENYWAIEDSIAPNQDKKAYFETCVKHYKEFWKRGISTDVISMDTDLEGYDILVAPMLYMVKSGLGQRIEDFCQRGGTFVTTYWSGIVDDNDLCFTTGRPGPLRKVLGIWSEEIDALYEGESNHINMLDLDKSYEAKLFCDLVHLEGAKALAHYESDFYAGRPALTVNQYGRGHAYYICSRNDEAFFKDFYDELFKNHKIRGVLGAELPLGVTVNKRVDGEESYYILQNYNGRPEEVNLNDSYQDLISGEEVTGDISLSAYGYRVLRALR